MATNIGSIDDLIAIAHGAKHLHTHGRLHNRREAAGDSAKLEADIRNIFALDQTQCSGIQAQGVVVGSQQIAGQRPVVIQVGLEGDLAVKPLVVGACGDAHCASRICGNAIMPEETVEGYIGGVGDSGEMIAHRLAGLHLVTRKSLQVRVNERFADQIHKNKETDS